MECDSEEESLESVIPYLDMGMEEKALSEGKFPTYPNFPEEGDGSS